MYIASHNDIASRLRSAPEVEGVRRITGGGLRLRSSFPARVREATADDERVLTEALQSTLGVSNDGGRIIPVLMSVTARARDGHRILDWMLKHFAEQNPVMLWNHDRAGPPTIGRVPIVAFNKKVGELRGLAQFTPKDLNPFGYQVGEMVYRGYLHQPSVSWDTLEAMQETDRDVLKEFPYALRILMAELLEMSVVNIEADKGSGFGRAFKAADADGMELDAVREWATQHADEKTQALDLSVIESIAKNTRGFTFDFLPKGQETNDMSKKKATKPAAKRSIGKRMSQEDFLNQRIGELIEEGSAPVSAIHAAQAEYEQRIADGTMPEEEAPPIEESEMSQEGEPVDDEGEREGEDAVEEERMPSEDLMMLMQGLTEQMAQLQELLGSAMSEGRAGGFQPGKKPDQEPIDPPEGKNERSADEADDDGDEYWADVAQRMLN